MGYWVERMASEKLADRLTRLTPARRVIFAMCCVTHGVGTFEHSLEEQYREYYDGLVPTISEFWSLFPASLKPEKLRELGDRTEGLRNSEDPDSVSDDSLGEDEMKVAASCAFDSIDEVDGVRNAEGAAHQIYYAIVALVIENEHPEGMTDSHLAELESKEEICQMEIAFQLACARVLETWSGDHPTYMEVIQSIGQP